jgi:membrane protein DedA with SNARE-associated domain
MKLLLFLTTSVAAHVYSVYTILFIVVTFEGELGLLVLGIAARAGVIPLWHAIAIGIVGAIGKTFWSYYAGVALHRYIPKNSIFNFIEHKVLSVFPHFREKPFWSIFFSKFVYGLNHFTSIFAGYRGVPFKLFATAELSSSGIWLILMFSIGYFFSHAAFSLSHNIQKVVIILLLCIVAFLVFTRVINWVIEWVEQ